MRIRPLAGLAVAALALTPAAAAAGHRPVKKTVKIGDNFFAPDHLKVPKGSKITWRWPSYAGDVHDVKLRKGPRGVKRFHSTLAASDYRFSRTLTKPGKYLVVCTIHAEMRMTIRVTR